MKAGTGNVASASTSHAYISKCSVDGLATRKSAEPRPIEVTAIAPIRASSIDITGIDLAKFGIIAIRVMRGTDVIRRWDA